MGFGVVVRYMRTLFGRIHGKYTWKVGVFWTYTWKVGDFSTLIDFSKTTVLLIN